MERIAKALVAIACLVFVGTGLVFNWPEGWLTFAAISFIAMMVMV